MEERQLRGLSATLGSEVGWGVGWELTREKQAGETLETAKGLTVQVGEMKS